METHANHLHHAPGKKFRHYFFEFFMLFLAVFCGFLAENYREHVIEHDKETQYMRSMLVDLKADTALVNDLLAEDMINQQKIDSLIHLLKRPDRDQFGSTIYYFARTTTSSGGGRFQLSDRTFEQMKSSGSLRLIHNTLIADSVTAYYSQQENLRQQAQIQITRMINYINQASKVFDGAVFQDMLQKHPFQFNRPEGNPQLTSNDPVVINEFITNAHYWSAVLTINYDAAEEQKGKAERLIQLLEENYQNEE